MKRGGFIYIMTNAWNTTLYIGVTSDLKRRIWEHKNNFYPKSFTARYNLYKLVYFEGFHSIKDAIAEEKRIKGGSRKKKEILIAALNPEWKDLFDEISQW